MHSEAVNHYPAVEQKDRMMKGAAGGGLVDIVRREKGALVLERRDHPSVRSFVGSLVG